MFRPTVVMVDVRSEQVGATVVSGAETVILGPFNLLNRPTKTFTLYNAGALTLSGAVVQVNPDPHGMELGVMQGTPGPAVQIGPNPVLWQTYDSASFSQLGAGQVRSITANDLFRWWRIIGLHQGPNTSIAVSGWVNAATI